MKITVLAKLVPDLVEELIINDAGDALDTTWIRLNLNEFDDHAIEQAMLLKEQTGAHVTVIVPDVDGADDVLFSAAARGADRLVKLCGDFEQPVNNHALARLFAAGLQDDPPDLILTGVQAHNDLDGALGPLLAGFLSLAYVGYVSGASPEGDHLGVRKEYPGGLVAEMEVALPAVLGVQAAGRPLTYVAFSKIRQAMKTASIDEVITPAPDPTGGTPASRLFKPDSSAHAEMITGGVDQIAARLVEIFQQQGVL